MTATLNSFIDKIDALKKYIASCNSKGIAVLGPDVNKSEQEFSISDGQIRFGLKGIKTVGALSQEIIEERNERGKFEEYQDFLYRMAANKTIRKQVVEALIYSGSFDEFSGTRKEKIDQLEKALNYVSGVRSVYSKDSLSLYNYLGIPKEEILKPVKLIQKDGSKFSEKHMLSKEMEYTSFYITGHPIDRFEKLIEKSSTVKLSTINDAISGDGLVTLHNGKRMKIKEKNLYFTGAVSEIEEKISSKGNKYYIITIEDRNASIQGRYFFENDGLFALGDVISVAGRVNIDDGNFSLNITDIISLETGEGDNEADRVIIPLLAKNRVIKLLETFKEGSTKVIFTGSEEDEDYVKNLKITSKEIAKLQNRLGFQNVRVFFKKD